jgi:hypothetical protein
MFLMDKIQHTKQNFKEISQKTLLEMIRRKQGNLLFPELMKRFTNKNTKLALFAMGVVAEAFKTRTGMDDLNLKQVFKSIQTVLISKTEEARDGSYILLEHVYANCSDDAETVVKNCSKLRGVQATQLKDMLQKATKHPTAAVITLFDPSQMDEVKVESQAAVKGHHSEAGQIQISSND